MAALHVHGMVPLPWSAWRSARQLAASGRQIGGHHYAPVPAVEAPNKLPHILPLLPSPSATDRPENPSPRPPRLPQIDVEDSNGKGRKPAAVRRGGWARGSLRPLLATALTLTMMVGAFTVGSHLGVRYAYVTSQLHIDSQLAHLHRLAKRRLSAITGEAAVLQADSNPWPARSFAEAEQHRMVAQAEKQQAQASGAHYNGSESTLSFQVCNGFANQRAALLSGGAHSVAVQLLAWGHTCCACFRGLGAAGAESGPLHWMLQ